MVQVPVRGACVEDVDMLKYDLLNEIMIEMLAIVQVIVLVIVYLVIHHLFSFIFDCIGINVILGNFLKFFGGDIRDNCWEVLVAGGIVFFTVIPHSYGVYVHYAATMNISAHCAAIYTTTGGGDEVFKCIFGDNMAAMQALSLLLLLVIHCVILMILIAMVAILDPD